MSSDNLIELRFEFEENDLAQTIQYSKDVVDDVINYIELRSKKLYDKNKNFVTDKVKDKIKRYIKEKYELNESINTIVSKINVDDPTYNYIELDVTIKFLINDKKIIIYIKR